MYREMTRAWKSCNAMATATAKSMEQSNEKKVHEKKENTRKREFERERKRSGKNRERKRYIENCSFILAISFASIRDLSQLIANLLCALFTNLHIYFRDVIELYRRIVRNLCVCENKLSTCTFQANVNLEKILQIQVDDFPRTQLNGNSIKAILSSDNFINLSIWIESNWMQSIPTEFRKPTHLID